MRVFGVVGALLVLASCAVDETPLAPAERVGSLRDALTGRPKLLAGNFSVAGSSAEAAARAWLTEHAAALHLEGPNLALPLVAQREGLAGTYVRFAQLEGGLPVFGGEVIVLVAPTATGWAVRAANLAHREGASTLVGAGDVGEARAVASALEALKVQTATSLEALRGVAVTQGQAQLTWRVRLSTREPAHDFEVFVDAATGLVRSQRDRLRFVDGHGLVYDANPIASTGDATLRDNGGATTAALDAARFSVVLPRLDGSGFTRGQWVDAQTQNLTARASSPTNTFAFARDNLGFEQTNVYFHLDRTQARLQALGFTDVNNRVQVAVVNAQPDDNSFYSPQTHDISYGTGGVDDAEDAEITVHEYGHAVQDNQVPDFGGSDEGAMGEGFGDYLGVSFPDTLAPREGHPQKTDPACVGDWDSTSYATTTPRCLRRVDGHKHFPEAADGEVHDDGEMWSAALWAGRGLVGAEVMDKLVIESHFLLSADETFEAGVQAILTADQNLFGGAHVTALRRRFIEQGLSRLRSPAPAGRVVGSLAVSLDNERNASGVYAANLDQTTSFSVPGATGLVLHFSRLDTQTSASCFEGGCDNVYLTNGEGDLFDVLSGNHPNGLTAAAVAGETVKLRMVTDARTNRFGYHVDRIDVLGPTDGGVVAFDAGADAGVDGGAPDAGRADAGATDAGTGRADAGGDLDAGPSNPSGSRDAGATDAGTDAGSSIAGPLLDPTLGAPASNCGCQLGSGPLWLAALALTGRRRRQREAPLR